MVRVNYTQKTTIKRLKQCLVTNISRKEEQTVGNRYMFYRHRGWLTGVNTPTTLWPTLLQAMCGSKAQSYKISM